MIFYTVQVDIDDFDGTPEGKHVFIKISEAKSLLKNLHKQYEPDYVQHVSWDSMDVAITSENMLNALNGEGGYAQNITELKLPYVKDDIK